MKLRLTNAHIQPIAEAFSKVLNEWLTPEQLAEVNRLNETTQYSNGACATHNYCDANQAMIDAIDMVAGSPRGYKRADTRVLNAAWDLARKNKFQTA